MSRLMILSSEEEARVTGVVLPTRLTRALSIEERVPSERTLRLNLPVTLACNLVMVGLVSITGLSRAVRIAVIVFFMLLCVTYSIWASVGVALRMIHFHTNLPLIFGTYLANITIFGGLYFATVVLDNDSLTFDFAFPPLRVPADYLHLFVICIYYSMATMTHTGFGDIYPHGHFAFAVCCLEVLIGVAYNVLVFVVALSMFLALKDLKNMSLQAPGADRWGWRAFKRRFLARHPWLSACRRGIINFLFPVVVTWQSLAVVLLVKVTNKSSSDSDVSAIVTYALLQLCALLLMVSVSVRVASRMNTHQKVTALFLAQSYLSSIFMFAGLYFLIMVVSDRPGDSWAGLRFKSDDGVEVLEEGFLQLLYFSLITMSTIGYGDLYPTTSVGRLMCCFQMAAAQVYLVQIMGSGGSAIVKQLPSVQRLKLQSSVQDNSRADPLLRASMDESSLDHYEQLPPEVAMSSITPL